MGYPGFFLAKVLSNVTLLHEAVKATGKGIVDQITLPNNMRLYFERREKINVYGYLKTVWDLNVYGNAEPGSVIVDAGASIGSFSLKECERARRILAFEPVPYVYALLEKNIQFNKIGNIIPLRMALSDKDRTQTIFLTDQLFGSGHELRALHHIRQRIPVQCVRLDSLRSQLNLETVDLMKIDIEGHEIPCLRGAEQLLSKGRIQAFSIAVYHYAAESRECTDFLEDYGFRCNSRLFMNGDIILKAQLRR